ncbi:hypothetical protein Taro_051146 [Colocasia esculenta]|uniref:Uncharacterized protein n=1 Tax=Colocasia esculenta TaxID=4460 RepID=A0A843XF75_COLES|nr:hypothetical protein [Colocasia esculenta]
MSIGYGGGSSQYLFMPIIDPSHTFHSASSSGHHVTEEHVIEEDEEDEIDSQDDIDDNENMEEGDDEPLFDIVRVNNTEIEYEQDLPDVFTSDHWIDEAIMNNSHEGIDIVSPERDVGILIELDILHILYRCGIVGQITLYYRMRRLLVLVEGSIWLGIGLSLGGTLFGQVSIMICVMSREIT